MPSELAALLALAVAALFSGAALYINGVEQPARLGLDDGPLLAQWKPSYDRGYAMQAPLAVLGCALGLFSWWSDGDPWLLAGALLMIANWPFTLLAIMPVNRRLKAIDPRAAGDGAPIRPLVRRWGALHAVRTGLGLSATLAFLLGNL